MDSEIDFTVKRRGRFCGGFSAVLYEATPGEDETICTNHSISMHVGTPALVSSTCDGARERRMQRAGDLKIIPAGYSRLWAIDRPTQKLTVSISASLLERAADAMHVSRHFSIAPQLHFRDPRVEHICWAINSELEADEPQGRLFADSLGVALAAHLIAHYACGRVHKLDGRLSKRRLGDVMDYIAEHLATNLTLEELSRVINVSPSHFGMLFKNALGIPVHQYVIHARVEAAVRLLSTTPDSLSDVALQCGFANQSHMTKCMQRALNVTPGSLRRRE
ncbi:MAG: AraC family transcriptional regulator [Candidatus Eremiobacteraeota bacterium]|nr:AraC family transcriptional regulator [Candidatus Eremiobacteraeota bacterium]MDQ2864800.1 AraC family transcriptional regulator [Candidatus Eremiobacteraeota bacterium]